MTVRAAFFRQSEACAALGSPFMSRLMALCAERLQGGSPVADRVLGWVGDPAPSADSVPLRLAGALHALKIEGLALETVYPPAEVQDDALWLAVRTALEKHEDRILDWLETPPQTNEVRRAAVLAGALSVVAKRYTDPIELLELGCSGGLNLRVDHFCVHGSAGVWGAPSSQVKIAPKWRRGQPDWAALPIVARQGVDIAPIDPTTPEGRLKLLAYLWADQPERTARTEAAIEIAEKVPADITANDAGEWLEIALAAPAPGRTRVLFHTVAWQYFPEDTKARALAAMERHDGPLVRVSMENDGGQGARVTLTHYPSGDVQELGRADFHGRWVDWRV